jgi:succinoglycan biosynthesis protein ExoO
VQIDIALPFRGSEEYFKKTVESILGQSYSNWRLFVLDNANESRVCENWIATLADPRIQYFTSNTLRPLSRNFALAASHIQNSWGMILGADDILHHEFLREMVSVAEQMDGIECIHPRVLPINANGNVNWTFPDIINKILFPTKKKSLINSSIGLSSLCFTNWAYLSSMFFRKELFSEFPFEEGLENTFDLQFISRVLLNSKKIAYAPGAIFYYRRHSGTVSLNLHASLSRVVEERRIFRSLQIQLLNQKRYLTALLAFLRPGYRIYGTLRGFKHRPSDAVKLFRVTLGR